MKRSISLLAIVCALSLSACHTDPFSTKPEVKIDKEKVEKTKAEREE